MKGPTMRGVPFEVESGGPNFTRSRGVAYVDDEDLVLEVQSTVFGLFQQAPKVCRVTLTDLDEVRHKRGFRRDRLTFRTRPLDRIAVVPGAWQGTLCLAVKRSDRQDLAVLLDRLDLWIVE